MHYLLAVVEGETEKGLIEAFLKTKVGQSPEKYGQIEVVPIPAGGNQGYTKLVEVADSKINEYLADPNNCFDQEDDDIERWLVFDYDDIDDKKITLEDLRSEAEASGFSCVVSKPKIEFFILSLLKGRNFANSTNQDNYKHEINCAIDSLNQKDAAEKPGFGDSIKIPPYDKKIHQCKECLWMIFASHPELIDAVLKQEKGGKYENYSEIPKLLNRILNIINGNATT